MNLINKDLAIKLFNADYEKDVISILKEYKYWDDNEVWEYLGDTSNNYATIGNQATDCLSCFAEKIVNSIDAVLMKECLLKGILPDSSDAPKNMQDALIKFFNIEQGDLSNLTAFKRSEIGNSIHVFSSGDNDTPSLSLLDEGEGQEPNNLKDTILSIQKGVKADIQFVQGKWGMGGSGALQFGAGDHKLQLVLSKRNQEIPGVKDDSWGLTIIREFPADLRRKYQAFKYLAPNKEILTFKEEELKLKPMKEKGKFSGIKSGTLIKLYEYDLVNHPRGGRIKSTLVRHFNNAISTKLPGSPLPFLITDLRDPREAEGKNGANKDRHRLFNSLNVRLDNDKDLEESNLRKNLEEGYPKIGTINVEGQILKYKIYAFKYIFKKKDAGRSTYSPDNEGVILTYNGQNQGSFPDSYFASKQVSMHTLRKDILVLIDCTVPNSQEGVQWQSGLFSASRDRLKDGPILNGIKKKLAIDLRENSALKELRQKRQQQKSEYSVDNSKSMEKILNEIIGKNKSIAELLPKGKRISKAFKVIKGGQNPEIKFEPKQHPTFLKSDKEHKEDSPRLVEDNSEVRFYLNTDVENEYLYRKSLPGTFKLFNDNKEIEYSAFKIDDGIATLRFVIDNTFRVGQSYNLKAQLSDDITNIECSFWVKVSEEKKREKNHQKKPIYTRPNDRKHEDGGESDPKDQRGMPRIHQVSEKDWSTHSFDDKSALKIEPATEGDADDYYINVDNIYLGNQIKEKNKRKDRKGADILRNKFVLANVLIGISLLNGEKENKKDAGFEEDIIYAEIEKFTSNIALILLPIIEDLDDEMANKLEYEVDEDDEDDEDDEVEENNYEEVE